MRHVLRKTDDGGDSGGGCGADTAAAAAEAVAAAARERRAHLRKVEKAEASVEQIQADPKRALRDEYTTTRISHNMRLSRTLMQQPAQLALASVRSVLVWDRPLYSGAVFAGLQALVLFDKSHLLPGLASIYLGLKIFEAAGYRRTGEEYVIKYQYQHPGRMIKPVHVTNLNTAIKKADETVHQVLVILLKIHSAAAAVDPDLSKPLAFGL